MRSSVMYVDHVSTNQVLRLRLEGKQYKGLIVNMGDEAMLVATTSQEKPEAEPGAVAHGEIFTPEGLFHFTSKLLGVQMMPVMVLILERPRAMRKVQRRREARHDVSLAGLLVFISADLSINAAVEVSNVSFGGAEVLAPAAPPEGMHAVLLMRHDDREVSTIARVVHSEAIEGGYRIGMAFVEMSRKDLEYLHRFVSMLG